MNLPKKEVVRIDMTMEEAKWLYKVIFRDITSSESEKSTSYKNELMSKLRECV